MVETKVSLSLQVPGAGMLSPQECERNPKESYDEFRVLVRYTKGSGKNAKEVKEPITIRTRKQKLIPQVINICKESYDYMLETPVSSRMARIWGSLSKRERLKAHFDLVAHDFHAASYSFEVFGD